MPKHCCSALFLRNLDKGLGALEVLLVCEPSQTSGYKDSWRWALAGGKCCNTKLGKGCCVETPEDTIKRECKEETGYDVLPKKLLFVEDGVDPENSLPYKIYVFFVTITGGEPLRKKAFTQETPKWFPINKLPRNLFSSHQRFIKNFLISLLR